MEERDLEEESVEIDFQTVPQVPFNSMEKVKACLSEGSSEQAESSTQTTFSPFTWPPLIRQSPQALFDVP